MLYKSLQVRFYIFLFLMLLTFIENAPVMIIFIIAYIYRTGTQYKEMADFFTSAILTKENIARFAFVRLHAPTGVN